MLLDARLLFGICGGRTKGLSVILRLLDLLVVVLLLYFTWTK